MAAPSHPVRYTYAEYLALERLSPVKHEYLAGQIYAMAGGTPEHAALATTMAGLLLAALVGGRCRPYNSDLRVHVPASGLSTYPDVTVVCGPLDRAAEDPLAVTNPTLLVEVLSPSTEAYDRGEKFELYKALPSLRQYVLVSQAERVVEVWTRDAAGSWTLAEYREGQQAELASVGARIEVRALYELAAEPRA